MFVCTVTIKEEREGERREEKRRKVSFAFSSPSLSSSL